jgi:hypothetical protein
MIDASGNTIEMPKCEKCNEYKLGIIGKETIAWVCGNCEIKCLTKE